MTANILLQRWLKVLFNGLDNHTLNGYDRAVLSRAVLRAAGHRSIIESIYDKYAGMHPCNNRTIMVCKSCAARDIRDEAFTATEDGFQVLCFASGTIENLVRSSPSMNCKSVCLPLVKPCQLLCKPNSQSELQ